ncbi:MAG: haloacid dehalogenase, partial [Candidatus Hodarchaeota archaeon]
WEKAEQILNFDKKQALFIDDSEVVLKTAKDYGIAYVLLKAMPNSKKKEQINDRFPHICNFQELFP